MNSFLIVNDEDMNFVWDTIQEQQVILHPTIAPDGRFDFKKFFEVKRDKSLVLILDNMVVIYCCSTTPSFFLFFSLLSLIERSVPAISVDS